jgi:hypothetical protein
MSGDRAPGRPWFAPGQRLTAARLDEAFAAERRAVAAHETDAHGGVGAASLTASRIRGVVGRAFARLVRREGTSEIELGACGGLWRFFVEPAPQGADDARRSPRAAASVVGRTTVTRAEAPAIRLRSPDREKILQGLTKQVRLAPDVDLGAIAGGTRGLSAVELGALVERASLISERKRTAQRRDKRLVAMADLEAAKDEITPVAEQTSKAGLVRLSFENGSLSVALPAPTAGGRVGSFTVVKQTDESGLVLDVRAGMVRVGGDLQDVHKGSVRVVGDLTVNGAITRQGDEEKPPQVGEAEAIAAWLATPEGRKAQERILGEVTEGVRLEVTELRVEDQDAQAQVVFRYRLRNDSSIPLRNHVVFAAVLRTTDAKPEWQRLEANARPVLEPGGGYAPDADFRLARRPPEASLLWVFVSGLATYDIGVTVGPVQRSLPGGGGT